MAMGESNENSTKTDLLFVRTRGVHSDEMESEMLWLDQRNVVAFMSENRM